MPLGLLVRTVLEAQDAAASNFGNRKLFKNLFGRTMGQESYATGKWVCLAAR